jgi:hypothetical protein
MHSGTFNPLALVLVLIELSDEVIRRPGILRGAGVVVVVVVVLRAGREREIRLDAGPDMIAMRQGPSSSLVRLVSEKSGVDLEKR